MRGDALVQNQRLMAQAVFALADHIEQATGYQLTPLAFVDLPVAERGQIACISDSTVNTSGDVIAGGGTNTVLGFYDGANWKVSGAAAISGGGGGISEAPNDGVYYARRSLGWSSINATFQSLDATLTALAAYNTNGLLTQTAPDTFTGRTLTAPAAGITITNPAGIAGNPTFALADDLAALEALSGTNAIYYRSGTSAWTAVTIGTGLTFTSGTLAATATGGGNVSNSGTPTAAQYAKWVTATTIQGVAPATVLSDIGAAPLASPALTGTPTAPTVTPATDSSTKLATTAFVASVVLNAKILTISRSSGAASGNVSYTGAGFRPSAVVFIGIFNPSSAAWSVGFADNALQSVCIVQYGTSAATQMTTATNSAIALFDPPSGGGAGQTALLASYDADGFTLTWTKMGTPAAVTSTIFALCLR